MENTTNVAAVGAVTTPFWLPWLYTASELAATLAPILGAVWLTVQIVAKCAEVYGKWKNRNEDRQ